MGEKTALFGTLTTPMSSSKLLTMVLKVVSFSKNNTETLSYQISLDIEPSP